MSMHQLVDICPARCDSMKISKSSAEIMSMLHKHA